MDLTYLGMRAVLKSIFRNQTNKMLLDYQGGVNAIYIGMAKPGSGTKAAKWQIKKMTYDANDNITSIKFAGGSIDFKSSWSLRATYSYS